MKEDTSLAQLKVQRRKIHLKCTRPRQYLPRLKNKGGNRRMILTKMQGLICATQFLYLLSPFTQNVVFNMHVNFTLVKDTEGVMGFYIKEVVLEMWKTLRQKYVTLVCASCHAPSADPGNPPFFWLPCGYFLTVFLSLTSWLLLLNFRCWLLPFLLPDLYMLEDLSA